MLLFSQSKSDPAWVDDLLELTAPERAEARVRIERLAEASGDISRLEAWAGDRIATAFGLSDAAVNRLIRSLPGSASERRNAIIDLMSFTAAAVLHDLHEEIGTFLRESL
jgi:hypothetical protein